MEVKVKLLSVNLLVVSVLSCMLCGCAADKGGEKKIRVAMGIPHGQIKYEKIDAKDLELQVLGNPVARAGRPGVVTFALANKGEKKVHIPEWFSNESDNVGIFIQPVLPGMTGPDEKRWVRLPFEFKEPVLHYPVTLMPGNKVLVSKEIGFIKNIMLPPGEERMYFFKGALTLDSLPLTSKLGILRVTSNVEQKK